MTSSTERVPHQDRSRATRARLLAAAIDALSELGWAGTTVAIVAERAGVSRGAAQHHFPTREDLFTAALDQMTAVRQDEIRAEKLQEGPDRTAAAIEMLVDLYSGPLFRAALQIWVVASADPALRTQVVDLEARVARAGHQLALTLLGVDETVPGVRETVQGILDMVRGFALANLLTDDSARRKRVIKQWAKILDDALPTQDNARRTP